MPDFFVKNLTARVNGREVVSGVTFTVGHGELHALMGPNGSGKSSLAFALAGHPEYEILSGAAFLGRKSLCALSAEERAKEGIFLSFQESPEIGGIPMGVFLKNLIAKRERSQKERLKRLAEIKQAANDLGLEPNFFYRFLNKDFSGGEKKKSEILQLLALRPKFALFDEIDAGVDADTLQSLSRILKDLIKKKKMGALFISHSTKFFHLLDPDKVHVMCKGSFAKSGGKDLICSIEKYGFKAIAKKDS